jgi:tRNA/rRNA methyltransferase
MPDARVVLVGVQEPGNIGMVARAMKNFGLRELYLAAPEAQIGPESFKFAVGARDVLERARVVADLDAALTGVRWVAAATARAREEYPGEPTTPREVAPFLKGALEAGQSVALVFGRERAGLTNDELARAHFVLRIPTDPGFKSLNLAQAVLVVAYELFLATPGRTRPPKPAPVEAMEGFFADLERFLLEIGYTDERRLPHVMRAFRRVFHRAAPTEGELSMLRGLLRQSRWAIEREAGRWR